MCHQYIKHSGEQLHCKKQLHHKKVGAGEIPIETIAPLSAAVTPLLQTAVDCYRLLQTATDCFRLLQTAVLCHQPFGYSSSVFAFNSAECCVWYVTMQYSLNGSIDPRVQWIVVHNMQCFTVCNISQCLSSSALFFSVFPLCNVSQWCAVLGILGISSSHPAWLAGWRPTRPPLNIVT